MNAIADVISIYKGSDGAATRQLYSRLETLGPVGKIATELFRAQKASERAKAYRGGNGRGSYRSQAYDKKEWAIGNLCDALQKNANEISLAWGWGLDEKQPIHKHVLYVDLPTGQVSFHSGSRGAGPDYMGQWDGLKDASADRIVRFVGRVLSNVEVQA